MPWSHWIILESPINYSIILFYSVIMIFIKRTKLILQFVWICWIRWKIPYTHLVSLLVSHNVLFWIARYFVDVSFEAIISFHTGENIAAVGWSVEELGILKTSFHCILHQDLSLKTCNVELTQELQPCHTSNGTIDQLRGKVFQSCYLSKRWSQLASEIF